MSTCRPSSSNWALDVGRWTLDVFPFPHMASRSSYLFAAALQRIPGGVNSPVRAFRALDEKWLAAQSAKSAHGRIHPAGNAIKRAGEKLGRERGHVSRG